MQKSAPLQLHRILLFGLFFILIYLSFSVLKYFIIPVVWAMIITYMTWPIYQWILAKCGHSRPNIAATLMLCLMILMLGIPLVFGVMLLQDEGRNLYLQLQQQLFSGHLSVPDFILNLPVIGADIQRIVTEINNNPQILTQNIGSWIQAHLNYGRFVLSEISRNLVKLFLVLFSLFFFYRDGRNILNQVRTALEKIIGPRIHHYLKTISETTRAVVYGFGLTAVAQALLAGISYFVAGVPNPMLLTLITFVVALIPFGTPVAYCAVALWLFSQGQIMAAVGVLTWGVCVVSTADNLIRPIVISGATQIPFLIIMFGVLGGISSFGLVGLFIGPVILAILLAIWREWIHSINQKRIIIPPNHTD
ncbi:AI-2E family transporter [Acinetobacter sp. MD2(2019)]|uniref:AI-2E family transporter n=1 Tax=Acinetobacter sp. MD2(2019) TaxID=2605273 RepID=UPI002D1E92AB|nr:AI-2E family transporter [Acinetobacter sp. MD2(2019)]MEB3753270.1 AI-2E family transporter [Acinetobacter sp. MD2(2019)]